MSKPLSRINYHVKPGAPALQLTAADIDHGTVDHLSRDFGITFTGDSLMPLNAPATIGAPIQFLQTMLPGLVRRATTPFTIDELLGSDSVGRWEDYEVVQGLMEPVGLAQPYTDQGNIPLASFNPGWENRHVARFEQGYETGPLEEARMAAAGIDPRNEKRLAAIASLDFTRNEVGFLGFNAGESRTFGLLNDPGLPAFETLPDGASGSSTWASKTSEEVISDILSILEGIRLRSNTLVDPSTANITMAVPPSAMGSFGKINAFGIAARKWMTDTYANVRIVAAPQLAGANGGEDVIIAWADAAPDGEGSSDGGRTIVQMVPERLRTIGQQQGVKTFVEVLSNATAGVMIKRPYLVVAVTGV